MARITDIGKNAFTAITGMSSDVTGVVSNAAMDPFREIFDNMSASGMMANLGNALGVGAIIPIINDAMSDITNSIKSSNENEVKTSESNEKIVEVVEDNRSELEKIRDVLEDIYASMKGESFADIEARREASRKALNAGDGVTTKDAASLASVKKAAQSLGGIGQALVGLGSFRIAGMLSRVGGVLLTGIKGLVRFLGPLGILASVLLSLNEKDWGQIIDEITTGISEIFDEGHFLTGALRITGAMVDALTIGITRIAANIAGWLGFDDAADWLRNLADQMNMAQAMVDAYESVIQGVKDTWNGIKDFFSGIFDDEKTLKEKFSALIPVFLLPERFGSWLFENTLEPFADYLEEKITNPRDTLNKMFGEDTLFGDLWGWIYGNTLGKFSDWLSSILPTDTELEEYIKSEAPWMFDIVNWVWETIIEPIVSVMDTITEGVKNIREKIINLIPDWAKEWVLPKDVYEEFKSRNAGSTEDNIVNNLESSLADKKSDLETGAFASRISPRDPERGRKMQEARDALEAEIQALEQELRGRRGSTIPHTPAHLLRALHSNYNVDSSKLRDTTVKSLGEGSVSKEEMEWTPPAGSLVPRMRDSSQMIPSGANQSAQNNIVAPVDNRTYNISQGNSGNQSRGPAPRVSTSPMQLSTLDRRIDNMFFGSISSV